MAMQVGVAVFHHASPVSVLEGNELLDSRSGRFKPEVKGLGVHRVEGCADPELF
jgi:hypothetical protein